jgi:hypothetical protein
MWPSNNEKKCTQPQKHGVYPRLLIKYLQHNAYRRHSDAVLVPSPGKNIHALGKHQLTDRSVGFMMNPEDNPKGALA